MGTPRSFRQATAATEFAIVLPLLVFFAIAAIDFGRFVYVNLAVSNAARVGAEYGATHRRTPQNASLWEAQIVQAAKDELGGIIAADAGELDVSVEANPDASGLTRVDVEVAYPFRTIVAWPAIAGEVSLRHRVTMREFR
jgi:Flp pilus assembly protein TadG